MRYSQKLLALILLCGILVYLSCSKEHSCENCIETNRPPIAKAGKDTTIILPVDSFVVDGRSSLDPDGHIISYKWLVLSGNSPTSLINSDSSKALVKNMTPGVYSLELKVDDNDGLFATDTIKITVIESGLPSDTTASKCDISVTPVGRLPAAGMVYYAVTGGTKMLFTRSTGAIDIYDTVTKNWQTVNGMLAASRYMPEQSSYKMARVGTKLIFSTMTDERDKSQGQLVNIYDFSSDTWSIDHLAQARQTYAVAVAGNKVFYAGGVYNSGSMDVYDAAADSWSVSSFNGPSRIGMSAINFDNKIYFAGGYISRPDSMIKVCDDYGNNCNMVPAIESSNRIDILDVSSNTWSVTYLSEGRTRVLTAILRNRIVFAGGEKVSVINSYPVENYSSRIEFYDPVNMSWSVQDLGPGNPIIPDYNIYPVHSKLLIPQGAYSDKVNIYDDLTNSWSIVQMPYIHEEDLMERGLVTIIGDKIIFFLQFVPEETHSRGIDIYNASTNTWCHSELDFNLIRTGFTSIGNKVYFAGGFIPEGNSYSETDVIWNLKF